MERFRTPTRAQAYRSLRASRPAVRLLQWGKRESLAEAEERMTSPGVRWSPRLGLRSERQREMRSGWGAGCGLLGWEETSVTLAKQFHEQMQRGQRPIWRWVKGACLSQRTVGAREKHRVPALMPQGRVSSPLCSLVIREQSGETWDSGETVLMESFNFTLTLPKMDWINLKGDCFKLEEMEWLRIGRFRFSPTPKSIIMGPQNKRKFPCGYYVQFFIHLYCNVHGTDMSSFMITY